MPYVFKSFVSAQPDPEFNYGVKKKPQGLQQRVLFNLLKAFYVQAQDLKVYPAIPFLNQEMET